MQLNNAPGAVLLLVVIGITAAIGARVTNAIGSTMTGAALGAATNATQGISEFAGFLPVIGLVIAASIVIGLIVMAFAFNRN